jgi:hypothetical protein
VGILFTVRNDHPCIGPSRRRKSLPRLRYRSRTTAPSVFRTWSRISSSVGSARSRLATIGCVPCPQREGANSFSLIGLVRPLYINRPNLTWLAFGRHSAEDVPRAAFRAACWAILKSSVGSFGAQTTGPSRFLSHQESAVFRCDGSKRAGSL